MNTSTIGEADVALVDLIDRVIAGGVVVRGDIVLSIAGVDLVYLGLYAVLAPARKVPVELGESLSKA